MTPADRLIVLYPGSRTYDLDRQVHVMPPSHLAMGNFRAMFGKAPRPLERARA